MAMLFIDGYDKVPVPKKRGRPKKNTKPKPFVSHRLCPKCKSKLEQTTLARVEATLSIRVSGEGSRDIDKLKACTACPYFEFRATETSGVRIWITDAGYGYELVSDWSDVFKRTEKSIRWNFVGFK